MLNNVLDHSEGLKIPGQKPNIPGHMVADAAGPKRWKLWRYLNYDYFSLMKCKITFWTIQKG
jgi:hypothetical protein